MFVEQSIFLTIILLGICYLLSVYREVESFNNPLIKGISLYLTDFSDEFGFIILAKKDKKLFLGNKEGIQIYNHLLENKLLDLSEEFSSFEGLNEAIFINGSLYRINFKCAVNPSGFCFLSYVNITHSYYTQKKLLEASIRDDLTGLFNRNYLLAELMRRIQVFQRNSNPFCLLYLDINKFKLINDTYGHQIGDLVIQHIANVLVDIVRPTDIVSRISGDEFNIILDDCDQEQAIRISNRLIEKLSSPYVFTRGEGIQSDLNLSVAIGVGLYKAGEDDDQLIRKADLAMYKAKQKSHKTNQSEVEIYDDTNFMAIKNLLNLEDALYKELKKPTFESDLYMVYQPVYDIKFNKVIGFEALVRWRHNDKIVYPDSFIPVAEKSGLIDEIFAFGVEYTCKNCYEWIHRYPNFPYNFSINLSPKTLNRRTFVIQTLDSNIKKYKLHPNILNFEITESIDGDFDQDTYTSKAKQMLRLLWELKNEGHSLSLDDWGTGYSSIKRLFELPVSRIKIDKYFIFDLENDLSKQNIVRAVIDLSQSIGLEIVAEGVQDQVQIDLLLSMGCDYIQGYFIDRPLLSEDLEKKYLKNLL